MKEIKSENQDFKNSIEFIDLTNHHHQRSGKDNHLMWDVHILRVVHEKAILYLAGEFGLFGGGSGVFRLCSLAR